MFDRNKDNYGIIHDDIHTGNVLLLDNDLVILDFDLSHYSWFIGDIASTLLFRTWIGPEKEKPDKIEDATLFLKNILLGYTAEHNIEETWAEKLPLFLKLREISLFQSMYSHVDLKRPPRDNFFKYVYQNIENNKPFLDIDFKAIY